jgi:hypothetical protein
MIVPTIFTGSGSIAPTSRPSVLIGTPRARMEPTFSGPTSDGVSHRCLLIYSTLPHQAPDQPWQAPK